MSSPRHFQRRFERIPYATYPESREPDSAAVSWVTAGLAIALLILVWVGSGGAG